MGSQAVKLSFYTVTTPADGEPVETLLHEDISGTLETDRQIVSENVNQTSFVQLLVFYPGSILSGLTTGMKVTSDTAAYVVQYEETYSDHQEIYLRKVNA
jgi:hypothetical protein